MADDSFTPKPLDLEQLAELSLRLAGHADGIRNPAAAKTLGVDLRLAAQVGDEHSNWRFAILEVAAALPLENPAKKELLTLIGKPDLAAAPVDIKAGIEETATLLANWIKDFNIDCSEGFPALVDACCDDLFRLIGKERAARLTDAELAALRR